MIEKMKKITIPVSAKEREAFVSELRALGVLHVKHVVPPEAHEISFVEERISRIEKFIAQIEPYSGERPDRRRSSNERDVLSCYEDAAEDMKTKRDAEEKLEKLRKEKLWYEEWEHIDPREVRELSDAGVNVRLYSVPAKDLGKIDPGKILLAGRSSGRARVVFISGDKEEKLLFPEVAFPAKTEKEMEEEALGCHREIESVEERMKERGRGISSCRECLARLKKEIVALRVRFGMKNEESFFYVQGFCPERKIPKIKKICEKHEAGFISEDPDDPDETPTLITNPRWIEIIKPVFTFMNTLPGYAEFDISFVFLVFFSLFFAMLIGDAGYGLIFISAAFLARRKFPKAPAEPFFLTYLLGGSTVVWGAITGTWFGSAELARLPVLRDLVIQKIGSFTGSDQNFIILICFIIGAVHLTVAHLMRIARQINSPTAAAEAGWIMILWGMFFAARKFVIGGDFPQAAGWALAAGIILVLFFTSAEKGIIKGALATAGQLPLSVISSFSDVVSYLRLFAVGYATVVVAESFNRIALPGAPANLLSGFLAALVLFLGHTLNILLGCMAVIVHGVRLNMLEFSGHLGMQWSGKKYEPFS